MKKHFKTILCLFLLVLFLAAGFVIFSNKTVEVNQEDVSFPKTKGNNLSLDQKIGQLFVIGVKGSVFDEEMAQLIKELHPGGVLLLKENIQDIEQLKSLVNSLQEASLKDSGLSLFVAVDQEGGIISRISWAESTPQSEIEDAEDAYRIGRERAEELKELGINLILGPLADAALKDDFIFERSFKKDKETASELAKGLISGQKEGGVLSCLKHFPGYGGIYFNPEDKLATLKEVPEISQFKTAAESSPEMVMISNVIYKELDSKVLFSFLANGIDFLKKEFPGDYLVVSDDLAQYSLLNNFSTEEIVSKPFNAGVDLLIFSGWRTPVSNGVAWFKKAVGTGTVSLERIDSSLLKIIRMKEKLIIQNQNEN